jgi:hypothetical protein
MSIKNALIVLVTIVFSINKSIAQHYEHTTLWAKTSVTAALNNNWEMQFEYVHRSQNNYRESRWNPLSHELLEEPRLWFYFKEKNYTIQLNPITYLYSEPLLGKEDDFLDKNKNQEWRSVVGLDVHQDVHKWVFKERIQYEGRWLKNLNYVVTGRFRLRGTVQYQVTPKTKFQLYNEVFLSAPPHKLANNFDQNWFSIGIIHKINDRIGFDLGIMRNYKKRANGLEFDHETGLNVGINFRLF